MPLATPLLTSPLLPPTLTMVTPALLFLPESSGFFSCGLKELNVYDVQIRLRTNLSTRARSCTLRSSEMIFFDCEEAPSSSPRMTAFALKLDLLLGGFLMIAIGRRDNVQNFNEKSKGGVLHLVGDGLLRFKHHSFHLRVHPYLRTD